MLRRGVLENLLEGDWGDEQWEERMAIGDGYDKIRAGKVRELSFDNSIKITGILSVSGDDAIAKIL